MKGPFFVPVQGNFEEKKHADDIKDKPDSFGVRLFGFGDAKIYLNGNLIWEKVNTRTHTHTCISFFSHFFFYSLVYVLNIFYDYFK